MKLSIRVQLFFMMFLEFFVWGLWFVTMGTYISKQIGALDTEVGLAYGTQSLGAIIAPFFIGLIADKYFSAQKILGILHLIGAALLFYITLQDNFNGFYPILLVYMIIYMPTLALVNSIALNQVTDAEKQFAGIRVWGTIGWISACWIIGSFLKLEQAGALENTFRISAVCSLILGIFSFTLPDTPPISTGPVRIKDILGLDALRLLKDKNYLIFFLTSILISIPLAFYYQETNIFLNEIGVKEAATKMSFGQMSEMILLFLMPVFFRFFGVKKMLLLGMMAWLLRYLCFSYGDVDSNSWMLYLGIILHGICYDFFFVTGQIYTDQKAPKNIRSSAQGMITLATYGIGMLIGFSVAGYIADYYKTNNGHSWYHIWLFPAFLSFVFIIIFLLFFKNEKKSTTI